MASPSLLPFSLLLLALSTSVQIGGSRRVYTKIKESILGTDPGPRHLTPSSGIDPSRVSQISWHPRVFMYEGFLLDDECDHLIFLAQGGLANSSTSNNGHGNGTLSSIQGTSGISLSKVQDETISNIEERISTWTFLPRENGEDMIISCYGLNESHQLNPDFYYNKSKLEFGGHLIATVLLYLSDVARGGETFFPESELKGKQIKDDTWSDCNSVAYAVKPVKGNALLVFNLLPNASPDERSRHGACNVLEGEKWLATKWIHVRAFTEMKLVAKALTLSNEEVECADEDDSCPQWAAAGECQRNPVFMLGSPDYYGSCRKSCGACS